MANIHHRIHRGRDLARPAACVDGGRAKVGYTLPANREPTMSDAILHQPLTQRFTNALSLACELHRTQARKGTQVPYVAHLLAVAALVLEHGGSEDEAIAAVLHDAVEDQGGPSTAALIRDAFGHAVAEIVLECSDTDEDPKPPWRARKEAYIESVAHKSTSALLVSSADKVHNARCILADHRIVGEAVWDRFAGGRDGTLWYYRTLIEAFRARGDSPLVDELERVVMELETATSIQSPRAPSGASP